MFFLRALRLPLPERMTAGEPLAKPALVTSSARRSVVDQTPTTALFADAEATDLRSLVTSRSGSCSTVVWIDMPDRSSLPLPLFPVRSRTLIASKVPPRSTKNGSSRWPANTLPPPGRLRMAPAVKAA